jgi:dTDP-4-dehydrorhamnose 3,5-epimerase
MNITPTEIPEVLMIEPRVFQDERGFFFESFSQKAFAEKTGIETAFVQDNHSCSRQHVLRGLHYQIEQPQGKLVRVVSGEILDVAVDIRRSSPTFGQWVSCVLSAENKRQFWVPVGFAHGFLALSDHAEVLYKTTDFYAPAHERCILWDDPDLAIGWSLSQEPIVSAKDRQGMPFAKAEVFP